MVLRGQATVKGLSGAEISLDNAVIKHLEFSGDSTVGITCAECMKEIKPGDEVFILTKASVGEDQNISLEHTFHVVHLKGRAEGSCLEEFIARLIANTDTSTVAVDQSTNTQIKATPIDDTESFPD